MSEAVTTGGTEDSPKPVQAEHGELSLRSRPFTADERYEALARADQSELRALADRILEVPTPVEVVSGPTVVSAPLRLAVPGGDGNAVVGHVALTRCQVALAGVRGDGIRQGRSIEAAIAAAICDAEAERNGPLAHDVNKVVLASLERLRTSEESRARVVEQTRIGDDS
jgi:alpha-D-ribose 1-methylphosphonate 5-triphosphate synthase subunit PhnG